VNALVAVKLAVQTFKNVLVKLKVNRESIAPSIRTIFLNQDDKVWRGNQSPTELEYKYCPCESQYQTNTKCADPGATAFRDGRFKSLVPPPDWLCKRLILGVTWGL
jgi:hypothetical protein